MNSPGRFLPLQMVLGAVIAMLGLIGCSVSSMDDAGNSESKHHKIDITVENGEVLNDPGLVEVAVGDPVELRVSADVSDEVHVHGYDVLEAVEPGEPATISFVADVPGQFQAELEEHHQTILELQVR